MPVCGYVVLPHPDAKDDVERDLGGIPGCHVVPAQNRDVLLLVTEAASFEEDLALRRVVGAVPGIEALLLTFGEVDPDTPVGDPVREGRS